jgi:hypothetical protein
MRASPRPWWAHALVVVLGVGGLGAGLLVGLSGCGLCMGPCPQTAIEPGTFTVIISDDRPELVGAMVEITHTQVELSFTDAQGHDWVIDYTFEK